MANFVTYGEIVLDRLYGEDKKLILENGGYPCFNVIYNIAMLGGKAYAVGGIGEGGDVAKTSLKKARVNVSNIIKLNKPVAVNNIIIPQYITSDNSVKITASQGKDLNQLSTEIPKELKNADIILNVSNFHRKTFEFIKEIKKEAKSCKVILDIGNNKFGDVDREYIDQFLRNVDVIQINEKAERTLYEKLDLDSYKQIFSKYQLDLLIETQGSKGARYIYNNDGIKEIQKKPKIIIKNMTDPTGAGDAFLAVTIYCYARAIHNNKQINEEFVNTSFECANTLSRYVIQEIGTRGDRNLFNKYKKELINVLNLEER